MLNNASNCCPWSLFLGWVLGGARETWAWHWSTAEEPSTQMWWQLGSNWMDPAFLRKSGHCGQSFLFHLGKYFCEVTYSNVLSSVNIFSPFKAKQRAEVLQSTQRFFSEQQQQSKPMGGKAQKVEENGSKPAEAIPDSSGVCQDKAEEKPPPAPAAATKPVRTGPIKPQAIKTEETKS